MTMLCKFCDTPLRPGQTVCPNCGGISSGVEQLRNCRKNPAVSAVCFTPDAELAVVTGQGVLLELPACKNIREHHLKLTENRLSFTCGVFDSVVELPCSSVTAVLPKQTESGIFSKVHNFFLCFTASGKVYEFEFASEQSPDYRSTDAAHALTRLISELRRFFHTGGRQ